MTSIVLSSIDATYVDAWGKAREVSASTINALAQAFDSEPQAALPVVVHCIAQGDLSLSLPPVMGKNGLATLRYENGSQSQSPVRDGALNVALPLGYHRLSVETEAGNFDLNVIGVPEHCYVPEALAEGTKVWGIAAQLYSLRSEHDWGMGDFGSLMALIERCAGHGVDVIGLNPLHALYPAEAAHISPYSPSHRAFLNWLYVDPQLLPEWAECLPAQALASSDDFAQKRACARTATQVDYVAVAALKRPLLEVLFQYFQQQQNPQRHAAFALYCHDGGPALYRHALFDTVHEYLREQQQHFPWPSQWQNPASVEVLQLAAKRAERLRFFQWLQWLAHEQLHNAQQLCQAMGMRVGLYRDLAVGADASGSECWSAPQLFCREVSVGAPPDAVAVQGQDWGLPAPRGGMLRDSAYETYIELFRENMRDCGALRIDHVMALFRLWCIPRGHGATDGAYVRYPLDDLAGIVALESQRNQCMVIGEDLGTVPDAIRQMMNERKMFSYRVLMFEQDGERLKAPAQFAPLALATISTHDMPTLVGYWDCEDIKLREKIRLYDAQQCALQYQQRVADKHRMLRSLKAEHLFSGDTEHLAALDDALVNAIHVYLARSSSRIMMTQIEELVGERHQVNLPGTHLQHANWQRKVSVPVEQLFESPLVLAICNEVTQARRL